MEVRISELMDHYEDREFLPAEPGDLDAEAVRARVMARLAVQDKAAPAPARRRRTRLIWALAAAAALLVCLATVSAAGWFSIDILGTVRKGNPKLDTGYVQSQIEKGEWYSLNGNTMAVICPGAPASVIISRDRGNSWREVVIEDSEDDWAALGYSDYGEEGSSWYGGFIDLHEDGEGLLVLASGVAMNYQHFRFYLTADGGDSWSVIPSVNAFHTSMMTGAGLAGDGTVCVSFRYYEDFGPDLWYSDDRGETWRRAAVERPEEYREHGGFTPLSPAFDGLEGELPVTVTTEKGDIEIALYSHDGGRSWMPN